MLQPPFVAISRHLRGLGEATPARIRTDDDPVLTQTSNVVSAIDNTVLDIIATLHATLGNFRSAHGFGRAIAAPQIGELQRIIAVQLGGTPFTLINPEITRHSDATFSLWDDCLSVPDQLCQVIRSCSIDLHYLDESGKARVWTDLSPELAELVQHEVDHLDGVLMTARAQGKGDIRPIAERGTLIDSQRTKHRLSLATIARAHGLVDNIFTQSPQYIDEALSDSLDCELLLKLETANPLRSFKGRGASFLIRERLAKQTLDDGIVCASAGNWGQAVAYSCRSASVHVSVFVSSNASALKVARMRALGADVRVAGSDFDAAKDAGRQFAADNHLAFVEDGREAEVSEGHGTLAIELLAAGIALDVVIVPLGNGALLAGIARWLKASAPATELIGVCARGADAMYRSWQSSTAIITQSANTIADGIAVRVPVPEAVSDLDGLIDDVVLVDDSHIVSAMQLALTQSGLVLEPAGAVAIAAVIADQPRFRGRSVAVILTGSNISVAQLHEMGVC